MFRREALRRFAAAGVAATLAGCGSGASRSSDGRRPPTPPEGAGPAGGPGSGLQVASLDYREGDSGDLLLAVEVRNRDDQTRSGTVQATVTLDGEEIVASAEVTVAADDSEAVEVPFDVPFHDFEDGGSVDLELAAE